MNDILGTPKKWQEMGFCCGVEIHHQLNTEKKLFCRCPAGQYSKDWHAEVLRHMRPTMSELGEYDGTALMEFKTRKQIIYRLHRDYVCTYDMDDNPPFAINPEAVDKALTIALAFKCKMVGELHVIRKQYLDGSIPTGFQRTCIIGVDGVLPLSGGREIRIIQIGLEEDACREITDIGHKIVFAVDRLGTPLIEVVTEKSFETPEDAAEGVERIRRLLRATGFVRRGIGAGRQDVNVSIKGSTRVEIKGVPRIPRIPFLTAHEAARQASLLTIRDKMLERGLHKLGKLGEGFPWDANGRRFHRPELAAALSSGDSVRVIRLNGSRGLLSFILTGRRSFADELSGRVRVIACLDQYPNILHTDGETGGLNAQDRKTVEDVAGCGENDAAVVVWGPERDTITAMNEVIARWEEALLGVPNETRQALSNNTTDFERILPGPDRMYPDTDSAPLEITDERVADALENVPEYPWVREERYRNLGLPEDVVYRLAISRFAPLFDEVVENKVAPPLRAGEVLTSYRVALRRKQVDIDLLGERHFAELLPALGNGRVQREILPDLLELWTTDPCKSLDEILKEQDWTPATGDELAEAVAEAVEFAGNQRPEKPELHAHIAMGRAMRKLAGRAPGAVVMEKINELIKTGINVQQ